MIIKKKKKKKKKKDIPANHRVKIKENEKRDKYLDFSRELGKLCNMKVMVIPIVIGTLGRSPKVWKGGRMSWKLEDESRPFKLQHC